MSEPTKPFFVQALDALKLGDRGRAAALLEQQIRFGNTSAKNLPSVAQLAEHIGEIMPETHVAELDGRTQALLSRGAPEDVAYAICLLVRHDFLQEANLVIDGGLTMRIV